MLGVLSPLWLAGLASLAVPLALHLWSRQSGRALRVGSIRLLAGAPPPLARRPRVHDPWLLLLRCAVLGILVLALARPYWTPRHRATPIWALVTDDVSDRAALVDSLEQRGVTVHAIDRNDLWLSLTLADGVAPPGTRFEVFATPLLRGVRGMRPALRSVVRWHPRPSIEGAASPAPLVSRPRIVAVFADASRSADARYVTAAFRAVGFVSGIPAIVTAHAAAATDTAAVHGADWIVWLSDEPLADVVRRRLQAGATVLTDAGRTPPPATRITFEQDAGIPVWSDGTGAPLLTVDRAGRGLRYRFRGRFAPRWSDIVLDPGFPEAIARLWIGADSTRLERDDRPIALSQVLPAHDARRGTATPGAGARSLFVPLWLIATALFVVERRVATRSAP